MALNTYTRYAPDVIAPDANYPYGSLKDETVPGAFDGTPLTADWGNDVEGFKQAVLSEAGITPSGNADTATDSQMLDGLKDILTPRSVLASEYGSAHTGFKLNYVGTVLRTLYDTVSEICSVKHFGALGDGTGATLATKYATLADAQAIYSFVTSLTMPIDTAAIIACWNYVTSKNVLYYPSDATMEGSLAWRDVSGPRMFFPAGQYIWSTDGLNLEDTVNQIAMFSIAGESSITTEIKIIGDYYFIDSDVNPKGYEFLNLKVTGGLGGIKYTSTAQNQVKLSRVENCFFSGYRECAVGHSSQDWPNIKIKDNQFAGKSGYSTIACVISGLSANSEISGNEVIIAEGAGASHVYGFKLSVALNDSAAYNGPATPCLIADNGFYRGSDSTNSTDVWIVPNPTTSNNAGRALTLRGNKFGAENIGSGDYHILIADEDATTGTWAGNKRHATTLSTGYVKSILFDKNNVRFEPNHTQPYIASFTPNLQHIVVDDIVDNCLPVNLIEYRGSPAFSSFTHDNCDNLVYTRNWNIASDVDYSAKPVTYVSNIPSAVRVVDENKYINSATVPVGNSPSNTVFNSLLATNTYGGTVNTATKVAIDNSLGNPSEGATVTYSANYGRISWTLSGAEANRTIWLEMELKQSSSLAMNRVQVELVDANGTTVYFRRYLNVTAHWRMYRVDCSVPTGFTGLFFRIVGVGYVAGTSTNVDIGRVNAYHAAEPIETGHARCIKSAWNEQHMVIGAYHLWVTSTGVLRIKSGQPTSETDGTVVGAQA